MLTQHAMLDSASDFKDRDRDAPVGWGSQEDVKPESKPGLGRQGDRAGETRQLHWSRHTELGAPGPGCYQQGGEK